MNNTSEFIFDDVLTEGFTVVPNGLLVDVRLLDSAIGLYCRIIRCKNIPGWKIYQSTLMNKSNGETKIRTAMKNLIATGWIEKIQTRNEKGHISGIQYKVFSSSQKIDISICEPKRDFPQLDIPIMDNQELINKDTKKERSIINKDLSSSKEKVEEEDSDTDLILKESSKINLKLSRKVVEQLLTGYSIKEILRVIAAINNPSEVKNVGAYMKKSLVENSKSINITKTTVKEVKPNGNFESRDIKKDESLFGWDE